MNYQIVLLEDFTGKETTIYSVLEEDEEFTLFDKFIQKYQDEYEDELIDIADRLENIGCKFGAREQFFKLNEGKSGDGVCALYDSPDKHLRLYCIRYGKTAIIVGGGGPKNVKAWQDDPILSKAVSQMIQVSKDILARIKEREVVWSSDGKELKGNLKFFSYE